MRKYLSLLLAALSVACAKETQREAEVVFSLGVPSGQITRATPDGIAAALSACTPAGPFSLSAKSQTNELRTYAVTTGEALTMAVDSYAVTGSGEGRFLSNITLGVASTTPAWAVNSTVSVDGDGELSVPANYTCLALVFDKAKTEKITLGDRTRESHHSRSYCARPQNDREIPHRHPYIRVWDYQFTCPQVSQHELHPLLQECRNKEIQRFPRPARKRVVGSQKVTKDGNGEMA